MASHMDEPIAKRQRLDEEELYEGRPRYKSIKLDMKKYDEWVRELSEDELVNIFDLGVKVKESVTLTVDVNRKFMEETLSSQMQPIQESVSRDVRRLTSDLKTDIQDALAPKIKEIGNTMSEFKDQASKQAEQVVKTQENVTNSVSDRMTKIHESVVSIERKVTTQVDDIKRKVGSEIDDMKKNMESLKDLKGDVSKHMTDIKDELTERVDTVARRVPPLDSLNSSITQSANSIKTQISSATQQIQYSEGRVSKELQGIKNDINTEIKACNAKLDDISKNLVKPGVKGSVGEMTVEKILKRHFRNFSVEDVSRTGQKIADIIMTTTSGDKIMIEVKNRKSSVPLQESLKFEKGLASSPEFKAGILLSLDSAISNHALAGDFEVAFDQSKNQYRIYVPNALPRDSDESRVVWSVLMAEQLAKIRRELTGSQVQDLEEICAEFQRNVEQSKICEDSLKSLENAMKKLKQDITPFLETVRMAKERLSKLLHS